MTAGTIGGGWLRARLRAETRLSHDALDAAAARLDLSRRADCAAFLTMMAAATPPVEAAIARAAPRLAEARRRTPALMADLATLGLPAPPPVPVALPAGEAAALGALYVLEGARLGGLALSRALDASEDPAVRAATRFMRDPDGPALWKGYLAHLAAQTPETTDGDAAVAGALAAFDAYLAAAARWLTPGAATDRPALMGAA